jgi:hypothetical protein
MYLSNILLSNWTKAYGFQFNPIRSNSFDMSLTEVDKRDYDYQLTRVLLPLMSKIKKTSHCHGRFRYWLPRAHSLAGMKFYKAG